MKRFCKICGEPIPKKLIQIKPEAQVCIYCLQEHSPKVNFTRRINEGIAGNREQYWMMRDLPFQ